MRVHRGATGEECDQASLPTAPPRGSHRSSRHDQNAGSGCETSSAVSAGAAAATTADDALPFLDGISPTSKHGS